MSLDIESQLASIVTELAESDDAYLCDGDCRSGVAWSRVTEITIRFAVRGDELHLHAGSGLMLRFVVDSDGGLDSEGILAVSRAILAGDAVESFGIPGQPDDGLFATGYDIPELGFSGGVSSRAATFVARLAGPLESARLLR